MSKHMLGHLRAAGGLHKPKPLHAAHGLFDGTTLCFCQTCLSGADAQAGPCVYPLLLADCHLRSYPPSLQIFLIAVKSFSSHAATTSSERPVQPPRLTRAALTAASEQDMSSEQSPKAPAVSGQQVHHLRAQGGVRCAAVQASLPTTSLLAYSHSTCICRKPVRSLSKSNLSAG